MDYQNDINEIVSFIHGALPESLADYADCLARFTVPVDELRYWSVARQEAYVSCAASLDAEKRAGVLPNQKK